MQDGRIETPTPLNNIKTNNTKYSLMFKVLSDATENKNNGLIRLKEKILRGEDEEKFLSRVKRIEQKIDEIISIVRMCYERAGLPYRLQLRGKSLDTPMEGAIRFWVEGARRYYRIEVTENSDIEELAEEIFRFIDYSIEEEVLCKTDA